MELPGTPEATAALTSVSTEKEIGTVIPSTMERSPLNAFDRCDRCGAQAFVRAVLRGGSELLFCRHHARKHEDRLRKITVSLDESPGSPPL